MLIVSPCRKAERGKRIAETYPFVKNSYFVIDQTSYWYFFEICWTAVFEEFSWHICYSRQMADSYLLCFSFRQLRNSSGIPMVGRKSSWVGRLNRSGRIFSLSFPRFLCYVISVFLEDHTEQHLCSETKCTKKWVLISYRYHSTVDSGNSKLGFVTNFVY